MTVCNMFGGANLTINYLIAKFERYVVALVRFLQHFKSKSIHE